MNVYSAQRINIVRLLKLVPPEDAPKSFVWSAWTICEAWAERCGYFTAKAGRPDVYRAAVSILHHTGKYARGGVLPDHCVY
jgi:hypothetical protein